MTVPETKTQPGINIAYLGCRGVVLYDIINDAIFHVNENFYLKLRPTNLERLPFWVVEGVSQTTGKEKRELSSHQIQRACCIECN